MINFLVIEFFSMLIRLFMNQNFHLIIKLLRVLKIMIRKSQLKKLVFNW